MSRRSLRDEVGERLAAGPRTRRLVRWYAFHRSGVHVVSYPKSGRTWLRYVLGVALCEHYGVEPPDHADVLEINRLARMDRRIPSIRFSHDDNPHLKEASRLERSKQRYRSKDVVLLVRDPRDVVVSSYYQHTRRAPVFGDPGFEGSISEFVRHPVYGIETVVEFMNIWAENRSMPRHLQLVRYEDMTDDPARELERVLRFVGVVPAAGVVATAVEAGSFENMQAIEREDALGAGRLRPSEPDDPTSFKVRRGKVGGYVDELSVTDVVFVDAAAARLHPMFSYGSV